MTTGIKLHKVADAHVLEKFGSAPALKAALADKTETLHLICNGGAWDVSSQITGLRLARLQSSRDARLYMVYMLEHAGDELRALPNDDLCSGVIKEVHFKALAQVGA